MAIARFLDRMCLAFRASGRWLDYATLQNLIPSIPWIAPPPSTNGAIQGKEGIKFCHLATLRNLPAGLDVRPRGVRVTATAVDAGVEVGGAAGVLDVVGRGSHLSASSSTWETEDGKMDALLSNSQSWEV